MSKAAAEWFDSVIGNGTYVRSILLHINCFKQELESMKLCMIVGLGHIRKR